MSFSPQPCLPFRGDSPGQVGPPRPINTFIQGGWAPRELRPQPAWPSGGRATQLCGAVAGEALHPGAAPVAETSYEVTRGPGSKSSTLASEKEAGIRTPATRLWAQALGSCVPCPSHFCPALYSEAKLMDSR